MQGKINCLKIANRSSGDDIREGLTAIVSVKIEDPQFEGQTKQKLGNSEARGAVNSILSTQLEIFLEQNPSVAKITVEKSVIGSSGQEKLQEKQEILREENRRWKECLCRENLQTVPTKIL